MTINFFTVSLSDNIPTLLQSILKINVFYQRPRFTIICPDQSVRQFELAFTAFSNVEIKPESSVLTFNVFKRIAIDYCLETGRVFNSVARLGWYYQQVLKIAYLWENVDSATALVMWDADTLPTANIRFFEDDRAFLHGSLVEFHAPYFRTLKTIFGSLPASYLAFTVQFFSCTYADLKFINNAFESYRPKLESELNAHWIAKIILQSTYDTHGTLDGSNFSDQELIGIACLKRTGVKQHVIRYLRGGFDGVLSRGQIRLVQLCGFQHVTYENVSGLQKTQQGWVNLIIFLAKQLIRQRLFARLSRRNKESLAVHHH